MSNSPSPVSPALPSDQAADKAPTRVKDVFYANVTRDIAPVVYFHEQDPHKVQEEVSEYIVTGGYPEDDPRRRRLPCGIHEQFVKLLTGISAELDKKPGPSLPSSWVSGFYGSGKSSFAKLLGLALDGLVLPDGRLLSEVLIARDDSPRAAEFRSAWKDLRARVDAIAVVFDIGAVSRDDEHIHSAVKRLVQQRMGYCSQSHYVADYELLLELQGQWPEFLECAKKTLGRPWPEALSGPLAEEDFSHVMHELFPKRYLDPVAWYDSRAGSQTGIGTAVEETTRAIAQMLDLRAPGKTLFVVVDEVSQYIHGNDNRMLKLQTFVSDLGQKLKGRVWLVATGQQKLEDSAESTTVSKLKDRFPEKLRVHLEPSNIRDVVHKRLLRKSPGQEPALRALFQDHRPNLQLYGYACAEITEEDFVEVYPMLPGHVDLLMQVTTSLRAQSSRAKGDDYAIRGLLQLLGEMFRTQKLGDQALGTLVTLDQIYEVQHTALDSDVQNTLVHLFNHPEVQNDAWATKAARAVALLQLIADRQPTTSRLVAQCLYERLGAGNAEDPVRAALEKLRALGLVSFHDKQGYKIMSSAGQDWQRERDAYSVTGKELTEIIAGKMKILLGQPDRPRLRNRAFPFVAFHSDGRHANDDRIQTNPDAAVVAVDFRLLGNDQDRGHARWIQESDTPALRDRLVWVTARTAPLENTARALVRARRQVHKYQERLSSLEPEKQRLFFDEQSRSEDMERELESVVGEAFTSGEIYFRGRILDRTRHGAAFASILHGAAEEILPSLYPNFIDTSVSATELIQLLEPVLSGPSSKFMERGLGLLELDAGKYVASCKGDVPTRILEAVASSNGMSGAELLSSFSGPPCGYPPDVTRSCLAALLRGAKIKIRPEGSTTEITSVRDPGVKDLFSRERDLRRADILPVTEIEITGRDRAAICRFFEDHLKVSLDRENDAIADAVFAHFPLQVTKLQKLETRLNRLPDFRDLPPALQKLRRALEECKRSRQVMATVKAVKKHLDALRDGLVELGIVQSELTEEAVQAVERAQSVRSTHVAQLTDARHGDEVTGAAAAIEVHFQSPRPWRDIATLDPHVATAMETYRAVRLELIELQQQAVVAARETLRSRQDWEKLTPDEVSHVLRPLEEALIDTTSDAVSPSLVILKDTPETRIARGAEEADSRMDAILTGKKTKKVVRVETRLAGRELESLADIENLLSELRERLTKQLKDNTRLRLL